MITTTQIKNAYLKLPEKIRMVIGSEELIEIDDVIAKNYNLNLNQRNSLGKIVTNILFDQDEKKLLVEKLKEQLVIDDSMAQKISVDINTKIFNNLDNLYDLVKKNLDLENNADIENRINNITPKMAEPKIKEIVNKYGLSSSQATVLENEVMSVIERDKNEKITALDLVNLLNISNLLSEQIVFELESRVFERGVKIAEKPEPSKYVVAETKQTPIQASTENLSGTLNIPKEMMKPSLQNDALDKQKPSDGTSIGVPRYATEEIYKTETPVTNTMPAAANIVANKLNNVTSTIRPIETQYQKDPYREPLE